MIKFQPLKQITNNEDHKEGVIKMDINNEYLELEEIINGKIVEKPAIHPGLHKGILVLRQANIIQPPKEKIV